MAIYHLEGQVISRSQGRTATAAAAYRSCSIIHDERTGLTHNFEKKSPDLVASDIMLPKNAPKAYADRDTLWNAVEAKEKRKDAQLCREFNISLPRELSNDENWHLAKTFVQSQFVDRGMIADVNFHRGHKSQEEQPHIHVMLTMRDVTPDGFGKKNRSWNDKALLQEWREAWAKHVNERFQALGIDMRIDHRTLEAQGIDLEPQSKIGAKSAQAKMARFEEHQAIAKENGQRIIKDPSLVLKSITNQQSTFTHQDIARVVNRYTVDDQQFREAYTKVLALPELTALGKDKKGTDRYTTQTMLVTEKGLIDDAIKLSDRGKHAVDTKIKDTVIKAYGLSEGQREAFDYLMENSDMRNMIGIAGSGKSYLLGAVRKAHEQQGHRVIGMAMAGKAAENLQHSSGIAARTVASYIAAWDKGHEQLSRQDVVVIDEAGMLGSVQYARLLHEAQKHGAKVITAFDSEQLQAINAGAAARAAAEKTGFVELREVRRQKAAWQRQATVAFSKGETLKGLSVYNQYRHIEGFKTQERAMEVMLERWQEIRSTQPDKSQLMMAYTRREVRLMNHAAREILKADNKLNNPVGVTTPRGYREFCEGDRLYFMRNEYKEMDVRNGSLGTVEKIKGDQMHVRLDSESKDKSGRLIKVDLKAYQDLDHGYATTIHKSQGSSVDYGHLLASKHLDRHLTYVGMSRHKEAATLYWSHDHFKDINQMARTLSREQSKDFTLDYMKNHNQDYQTLNYYEDQAKSLAADPTQAMDPAQRMQQAQQRLEQRAFNRELAKISEKVGLTLSDQVKPGEQGIYKGEITIDKKTFGVIHTAEGQGKIVPSQHIEGTPRVNDQMTIERQRTQADREILVAQSCQQTQRDRSIDKSLDREIER